ncbi:MAG TPA: secretin N-terminal domain-containing protein, partial [Steroidobacteraceae bacterium]|nr:secretin N-terminal domain-containing protein [Steroidobacteraceae bacterium]
MSTRRIPGFAWLLLACSGFTAAIAADAPIQEERFDIEVNAAPAQSFFNGLVEGTHYNMLVHPEVAGNITLKMRHVTVAEALDAVKELYGYDYRRVSSGFVVLPATVQTRVFRVNYLDIQRSGISRTRVSSGQITDNGSRNGQNGQGDSNSTGNGVFRSGGDREGSQEITGTAILTQSLSKFWVDLEASVRAIVGSGPDRSVVTNAEAGIIAVRATPTELRDVGDYLASVEGTMTRQVLLEAKIVEVQLSDGFQAGINWAVILHDASHTFSIGQAGPQSFNDVPLHSGITGPIDVSPGNPVNGFQTTPFGGAFMLSVDTPDFNAFIDLLATQGNARVLSSPRVSTL